MTVLVGVAQHRRVTVAEQVDVGAVEPQRLVDPHRLGPFAPALLDRHGRVERLRLAAFQIGRLEVVEPDTEARQVVFVHPRAEPALVILQQRVAERLIRAGDEHPVAVPAIPRAKRDPDQQREQGEVKEEIAGLLEVALFRADRGTVSVLPHGHAEAARLQQPGDCPGIGVRRVDRGVCRQPVQPLRRVRGRAQQRRHVPPESRDQAAHQ